jgi:CBS domain-containing protein
VNEAARASAQTIEGGRTPVRGIMSTPARCVSPEMPLATLSELFLHSGISAAPVVDASGKAIGVISKTDILRHVEWSPAEAGRAAGEPRPVEGSTVADAMTELVLCLEADAAISRAAALMADEGVHRLVVTAPDGQAIGVVSSLDILRWLAAEDGYAPSPRASDRKGSA